MGGVLTTIYEWALFGYESAVACMKFIWQTTADFIKELMEFAKETFSKANFYCSYKSQGSSTTRETTDDTKTGKQRTHYETRQDNFDLQFGFNDDGLRKRNPPQDFSDVREQTIEQIEMCERTISELKNIMLQDREHENHEQTAEKLQDFMSDPNTQKLQQALNDLPRGNANLVM